MGGLLEEFRFSWIYDIGEWGVLSSFLVISFVFVVIVDCIGFLLVFGRRYEEFEVGVRDEELVNILVGKEDYRVGKVGESVCFFGRILIIYVMFFIVIMDVIVNIF